MRNFVRFAAAASLSNNNGWLKEKEEREERENS